MNTATIHTMKQTKIYTPGKDLPNKVSPLSQAVIVSRPESFASKAVGRRFDSDHQLSFLELQQNPLACHGKAGFLFPTVVESEGVPCEHCQFQVSPKTKESQTELTDQRYTSVSFGLLKLKTFIGSAWLSEFVKEKTDIYGKCFIALIILLSISSTASAFPKTGGASWYSTESCRYNPNKNCPTADGSSLFLLEENQEDFGAMWSVPLHSRVKVTCVATGKSVVVTIRDRGPAKRLHRVIDLSKSAFQKISDTKLGITKVTVEVLP